MKVDWSDSYPPGFDPMSCAWCHAPVDGDHEDECPVLDDHLRSRIEKESPVKDVPDPLGLERKRANERVFRDAERLEQPLDPDKVDRIATTLIWALWMIALLGGAFAVWYIP